MTMITMPWYVPSFWGDIRLSAEGEHTRVVADKLTEPEREALAFLSTHAQKKAWLDAGQTLGEGEAVVRAPLERVAKVIAKCLKRDRKLVSAITFADGAIEELHDGEAPATAPGTKRRGRPPKAAATVAAPRLGCPAPDFEAAHLRAQRVLESFLQPPQIADFRQHNRFVAIGHSGRRYMITSRLARDQLAVYHRSLYDLDDKIPLCCHDYDVPPAEEMLALHLLLALPGWELYLRKLESEEADAGPHGLDHAGPEVIGGSLILAGGIQDEFGRDLV